MKASDVIQQTAEYATRHPVDVASYGVVLGAFTDLLPPAAALMSIIWIGYQLWHAEVKRRQDNKDKQ